MVNDLFYVFSWWVVLFLIGASAYPMTRVLFASWWDKGYLFSKAVGLVFVSYLVWLMASVKILPFGYMSVILSVMALFIFGLLLNMGKKSGKSGKGIVQFIKVNKFSVIGLLITEELFFLACLLFWSWVKAHEPSIHGLEKFMDFGFAKSILNSRYFPPPDMWYAPDTINYYYFGHFVMALLTKLSLLDLSVTFNLMLATLFAFCFTMSFSIGYQLIALKQNDKDQSSDIKSNSKTKAQKKFGFKFFGIDLAFGFWNLNLFAGLLTAFLVSLAGNMQTIYAFTRGYLADNVKPFWQLWWPAGDLWTNLQTGFDTYWYANATRFIPFSIHEFPSYSFVVSDVHGHVLSIPFVLLAIALLLSMFGTKRNIEHHSQVNYSEFSKIYDYFPYIFYGLIIAVLFMTNALDGPIYAFIFVMLVIFEKSTAGILSFDSIYTKSMKLVLAAFSGIFVLPFMINFKSFVSSIAVNCPSADLAESRIGIFLFETVDKCQKSPLWMMWLLWGFFVFNGVFFIISKIHYKRRKVINLDIKLIQFERVLVIFFVISLFLIIFPEFFYFKDIYPAHFRSNTMFKLGYQAFMMFSILSGYTITIFIKQKVLPAQEGKSNKQNLLKYIFLVLLTPQLMLVSIYPYFAIRSYFGGLKIYQGLNGLTWLKKEYPEDYDAINWLNGQLSAVSYQMKDNKDIPVLVEAVGESYTDYARFSTFTGMPSVVGWPVHEWLWRGSYDVVSPRVEEVRTIYESGQINEIRKILDKYPVTYIIYGSLEKKKYPGFNQQVIRQVANQVYSNTGTTIYQVRNQSSPLNLR